ncbi:hypothetical protein [uncultured Clostridium sp.]|uniref:hypothetical protein n=1 Tax=uncultured Clostridium sp. TaxID=59620 RepID=UPI0026010A34|nr:hypothetical protein [uncultured Clostridium sp.]
MSKKLFSGKDIEILYKNKYVKKVSEKELHILMNLKDYLLPRMKKVNLIYFSNMNRRRICQLF